MAFFKNYIDTQKDPRVARLERLIWTLIYGGLLTCVLAYFVENTQGAPATDLYAIGILATAIGVVLIYTRSRVPKTTAKDKER